MARLGWAMIAVGLVIAASFATHFAWMCVFYPDRNDPLDGFLSMAGLWVGLIVAALGAVRVAGARGGRVPPV